MKTVWFALLLITTQLSSAVDATVFTDDFSHGSTLNAVSIPGGTPTASYTSYDIASTASAVTGPAVTAGKLTLKLDAPTTSGFLEAQARFTTSPIVLASVGDSLGLMVVFTDTGGSLLAGGSGSYLYNGLYNSGGHTPVAGALNNAGLNANAGSPFATGNAADWAGYSGRFARVGGDFQITYRRVQNGPGTTSANQDLVGNNVSAGAFNNPAGVSGSYGGSAITLTAEAQYTMYLRLTLSAPGTIRITNSLFSGMGIGGPRITNVVASFTGANYFNSFDGLAVGVRNSGTSLSPTMDISSITVTKYIQEIPEPTAPVLAACAAAWAVVRRFRRARSGGRAGSHRLRLGSTGRMRPMRTSPENQD